MTRKIFGMFLGALCIGALSSLLFVLYRNQKSLYTTQVTFAENLEKCKGEVQVIEKVVAHQPWAHVQSLMGNAVVRIIAQTVETNILQPYRTPTLSGGFGTGFFISESEIITNHHVIDEAQSIWIKIPSLGKAIIDVELVGTSPDRDLALLRVKPEGLAQIKAALGDINYLTLGDSDLVLRSDEVLALGYPLGGTQTSIKSSSGVVSGREHIGGRYLIQIDAPINPGSSGGPAVNVRGEVIGVTCAGVMGAQNVGYIIPSNELKMVLKDLRTTKLVRRPFLGVMFNNGSHELTQFLGNPLPGGCYVIDTYEGSPLAKAGAQEGDMVYEINGHTIDHFGDVTVPWSEDKVSIIDYAARLEVGQDVEVVIYRKGQRKVFKFKFDFSEMLPVCKIFPGYDALDYEIFAGMLIQPLCLNHLPALVNSSPSLAKYMEFKNQIHPALIVTHIIPNSQVQRLELFHEGAIITHVNGTEVKTLDDLRKAIRAGITKEFMTFKTAAGEFFAVSPMRALDDEEKLAPLFQYSLSPFIEELLAAYKPKK